MFEPRVNSGGLSLSAVPPACTEVNFQLNSLPSRQQPKGGGKRRIGRQETYLVSPGMAESPGHLTFCSLVIVFV